MIKNQDIFIAAIYSNFTPIFLQSTFAVPESNSDPTLCLRSKLLLKLLQPTGSFFLFYHSLPS